MTGNRANKPRRLHLKANRKAELALSPEWLSELLDVCSPTKDFRYETKAEDLHSCKEIPC